VKLTDFRVQGAAIKKINFLQLSHKVTIVLLDVANAAHLFIPHAACDLQLAVIVTPTCCAIFFSSFHFCEISRNTTTTTNQRMIFF